MEPTIRWKQFMENHYTFLGSPIYGNPPYDDCSVIGPFSMIIKRAIPSMTHQNPAVMKFVFQAILTVDIDTQWKKNVNSAKCQSCSNKAFSLLTSASWLPFHPANHHRENSTSAFSCSRFRSSSLSRTSSKHRRASSSNC